MTFICLITNTHEGFKAKTTAIDHEKQYIRIKSVSPLVQYAIDFLKEKRRETIKG